MHRLTLREGISRTCLGVAALLAASSLVACSDGGGTDSAASLADCSLIAGTYSGTFSSACDFKTTTTIPGEDSAEDVTETTDSTTWSITSSCDVSAGNTAGSTLYGWYTDVSGSYYSGRGVHSSCGEMTFGCSFGNKFNRIDCTLRSSTAGNSSYGSFAGRK